MYYKKFYADFNEVIKHDVTCVFIFIFLNIDIETPIIVKKFAFIRIYFIFSHKPLSKITLKVKYIHYT